MSTSTVLDRLEAQPGRAGGRRSEQVSMRVTTGQSHQRRRSSGPSWCKLATSSAFASRTPTVSGRLAGLPARTESRRRRRPSVRCAAREFEIAGKLAETYTWRFEAAATLSARVLMLSEDVSRTTSAIAENRNAVLRRGPQLSDLERRSYQQRHVLAIPPQLPVLTRARVPKPP